MKPAPLFTALLLASATVLSAQPAQPAATRGGHRFLILIEASKDMNRLADGVVETSIHLVASGFKGQARDGDAFAIWPYRDRVAGHLFEPVLWNAARLKEHEKVTEVFVAPLKYEGLASQELAMKELLAVGAASESATLILISPGEKPVSGTPFDTHIRNAYEREGRASRREKLPVVTAFLASGGLIVDCVVSRGGTNAALPTLPDSLRSKARAAAPPVIATNAPAPKKSPAPAQKKQAAMVPTPPAPVGKSSQTAPALQMSIAAPPLRTLPVTSDEPAHRSSNASTAALAGTLPPSPPVSPPTEPMAPASVSPPSAVVPSPSQAEPPAAEPSLSAVVAVEGRTIPVAVAAASSRRPTFILAGALIGASVMLLVVMIVLLLRPARGTSISAAMESGGDGRRPPGRKQ